MTPWNSSNPGAKPSVTSDPGQDNQRLLHELQVHQVELAQQNEDLIATQEELAASLRRYVALYEGAPVGLVTVDHQGMVRDINRQARALLGADTEPLVGKNLLPCLAEASREPLRLALGQPLAALGPQWLDIQLPASPGQRTRVLHADLQADPAGQPGVQIALTDITAQLALEAARLAEQARAEAANRAKSEFLARMSHDLRTPLNAVLGFAYLLQRDNAVMATPDTATRVNQIHRAGRHLLAMIDDLLDVTRIETGDLHLLFEPVNLQLLATDCVVLTESLASQHQVQVALAGDWQGRWAMADRRRLQQALLNLVSNAIKYNHPGGTVVVKLPAAATPGRLTLSVQDTGQGMSAEQIANLYQPFNRLGAERGQVEGTGLGLVIARQLLLAMGGDLTVESRPGAGSAFSVTLPSAPTPAAPQPVGQAPAQPAGRVAPVRPRTVLYVEDNPVNVALMEALLDTRPGVQLQVAEDGCAGLEAARRLQPDLILLDMHLPLMSGLEVLQHLRADPATAHLACVAVSANGMPEDIARARAEGFDDYVVKPIEPERLMALVDAIRA